MSHTAATQHKCDLTVCLRFKSDGHRQSCLNWKTPPGDEWPCFRYRRQRRAQRQKPFDHQFSIVWNVCLEMTAYFGHFVVSAFEVGQKLIWSNSGRCGTPMKDMPKLSPSDKWLQIRMIYRTIVFWGTINVDESSLANIDDSHHLNMNLVFFIFRKTRNFSDAR